MFFKFRSSYLREKTKNGKKRRKTIATFLPRALRHFANTFLRNFYSFYLFEAVTWRIKEFAFIPVNFSPAINLNSNCKCDSKYKNVQNELGKIFFTYAGFLIRKLHSELLRGGNSNICKLMIFCNILLFPVLVLTKFNLLNIFLSGTPEIL